MNRISVVLVLLQVLSIGCVNACSCARTTLKGQYHSSPSVVSGKVIDAYSPCGNDCSSIEDQRSMRFYKIELDQVYKGCRPASEFWVSSAIGGSLCGRTLALGPKYVLSLREGDTPQINSCQYLPRVSDLTPEETAFLATREVCCNEKCSCVSQKPPVNCYVEPCKSATAPCDDAVTCVNNYCGGCAAEWFTKEEGPACLPDPFGRD